MKRIEEIKENLQHNMCIDEDDGEWLIDHVERLEKVRKAAIPMMSLSAYMDVDMQMKLGYALKEAEE